MKKMSLVFIFVLLLCLSAFLAINKKPPTGFGSIKFGDKPEQIKGLVRNPISDFTSYSIYTMPGESLSFGGVKLSEVAYYFGHGGFRQAEVMVWGDENANKIEKECVRQWGKPERIKGSEALVWRSKKGCAGIIYQTRTLKNGKTEKGALLRIWDESYGS